MNSPENAGPDSVSNALWIRGALIERFLGCSRKTVHARALAENWPMRRQANRWEYQPPFALEIIEPGEPPAESVKRVSFSDLSHNADARARVLLREQAIQLVATLVQAGCTVSAARQQVIARLALELPDFRISEQSLWRWEAAYRERGLDGLVDQLKGNTGRPSHLSRLTPDEILAGRAHALDYGQGGKVNVARAARQLAADPGLSHQARTVLHGAHSSKSYVAPSLRFGLKVDSFTAGLAQIGAKHARLTSRWTPCDHSQVKAGDVITADDMTANCYVWAEWPNERGYLVIRPQILAVLDVGSLAWTNMRPVMRAKGQYTSDDVWGLVGDFLDDFGLPGAVLFEGGIWRSNAVLGHKTGLDDESRMGGLRSLGIKVMHSRQPRSKPIEMMFNQLQHAADAVKGYSGREEKNDRPEWLNRALTLCEQGKAHPREFFPEFNQYAQHIEQVMNELNHERQDGEILRGQAPAEKWASDNPQFSTIPESSKWLYRSAFNIETVTRNGVAITQRSGRYKETYRFDNPQLLTPLIGRRVAVYWNDHNPEADAVLLDLRAGKPCNFLGLAQPVKRLGRFSATREELSAEAQRKAAAMRYAVSQTRTLAPMLQRPAANLVRVDAVAERVGSVIKERDERAASTQITRRETAREISRVELSREDVQAAIDEPRGMEPVEMSDREISELFAED
jgi:hypothetical protein